MKRRHRPHWYRIYVGWCPVCGRDKGYREPRAAAVGVMTRSDESVSRFAPTPTTFTVNLSEPFHEWVTVVLTCPAGEGPHKPQHDTWAVRKGGLCLNRADEWEFEPLPSSRDDEFLARCRFYFAEAFQRGIAIAEREALWRRDAR